MVIGGLKIIGNYLLLLSDSVKYGFKRESSGFINATAYNARYILECFYENDFIFIHINKNGGSSIEKALGTKEQIHLSARTVMSLMGKEQYSKKFSFAFVRNPYDRVVSQYHYRLFNNQTGIKTDDLSFEDWVNKTYVEKALPYYNHPLMFQTQYDWISDHDGDIIVDFIGRLENFQADFNKICEHLERLEIQLPQRRSSKRKKIYKEYYNTETKQIITDKFQKDLDIFKYQF